MRLQRNQWNPPVRIGSILLTGWLSLTALGGSSDDSPALGHVPGRILLKVTPGTSELDLQGILAAHGAKAERSVPKINVRIAQVPEEHLATVIRALGRNPKIEFAEPDYLVPSAAVPNDPWFPYQWHLPKIQANTAWDLTTGSSAVTIAILDSGVNPAHPDLAPLMVPGWNFINNNSDTQDANGHGTAVAGCASAVTGNGAGVSGTSWHCKLMPIRVADAYGMAVSSAIASGLTLAADQGCRVANVSFEVNGIASISAAAAYFMSKGGVVVAGAGNASFEYTNADDPNVVLVSGTDRNDLLASMSNRGTPVDLCAPAVEVMTTGRDNNYVYGSGTSFSAPVVASVAGLIFSANPQLGAAQAVQILKQSADDLGAAGWDGNFGWGRVNARRAVELALATAGDAVPPAASVTSPAGGTTVAGTVTVQTASSDNIGVVKVELYVDAALADSRTALPAAFTWDTRLWADGAHTLQVRAYDAAGNVGVSSVIGVTVQNTAPAPIPAADTLAPVAQIVSPGSNATVSGKSVRVSVTSADNVAVTNLELLADGKVIGSSSSPIASFTWNISKLTRGAHTLQARASDAAGNRGLSPIVTVYK